MSLPQVYWNALQQDDPSSEALLLLFQWHHHDAPDGDTWSEFSSHLHRAVPPDQRNKILQDLFRYKKNHPGKPWGKVFLVVFWPMILWTYKRYWRWIPDRTERLQEYVATFLEVVEQFEVRDQKTPVWDLIRKATFDTLRTRYRVQLTEGRLFTALPEEESDSWVPAVSMDPELRKMDEDSLSKEIRRLWESVVQSGEVKQAHMDVAWALIV